MKIVSVVVTFNRLELLKRNIDCLRQQQGLSDLIVINNGSTDGTKEWLDSQKDLNVLHQDNVGGSGGFYVGINKAYNEGADWIWCMDDDVFPRPDCLTNLLKYIDLESIGTLVPRRIMDGQLFCREFRKFNFSNPFASLHADKISKIDVKEAIEIVGADFEGPFISRKVVEKIGLPNRDFFIFCDDTEYSLRTHLAGFKLMYIPEAQLDKYKFFNNDDWATRNQKKKWKRYYQVRNVAYLNHHYGKNWFVKYLRSYIGVLGYMITAIFTMPFSKAWQMKDLKMLNTAYKDGIHEKLGKR